MFSKPVLPAGWTWAGPEAAKQSSEVLLNPSHNDVLGRLAEDEVNLILHFRRQKEQVHAAKRPKLNRVTGLPRKPYSMATRGKTASQRKYKAVVAAMAQLAKHTAALCLCCFATKDEWNVLEQDQVVTAHRNYSAMDPHAKWKFVQRHQGCRYSWLRLGRRRSKGFFGRVWYTEGVPNVLV